MDQNDQQYPSIAEIPTGLGIALLQNKTAMDYYAALSDVGKQKVIDHTHTIESKEEMQSYVDALAKSNDAF